MALVTLNAIIGQVHGSIGALTFRHGNSGLQITRRRSRATPPSAAMSEARLNLSRILEIWRNLDPDTLNLWRVHAAMHKRKGPLGDLRTLTPFQWFSWWVPYGEAPICHGLTPDYSTPPTSYAPPDLGVPSLAFSASGALHITVAGAASPLLHMFCRIHAAPQGPTILQSPRLWYNCGWQLYTALTFDCRATLEARGIYLIEGQAISLKLQSILRIARTTFPTAIAYASTIVAA